MGEFLKLFRMMFVFYPHRFIITDLLRCFTHFNIRNVELLNLLRNKQIYSIFINSDIFTSLNFPRISIFIPLF